MSRRKPSIRDVAALAGVSTATVSNVFSGRKPVNDDLRENVRKAAEALGYQIDRAASQLRSGRNRIIAVLVPDLIDTFFATIVSRLETLAFEQDYDVIVASSHDNRSVESSRLKALLSWRPAGLVIVPCSHVLPAELLDVKDRLPMVLVDRVSTGNAIADTVTIDNIDAGEIAARHLLERGHRDIVLAVSHSSFPPLAERVEGASKVVASYVGRRPRALELGSNVAAGAKIFSDWLERNPLPGAVIALTNVTTLSVLSALAQHRIEIPSKTSVIAFDDYAWMSARNTGLTAVRQPVDDIASMAWNRLTLRMEEGARRRAEPTVLNASLVIRASVKELSPSEPAEFGKDGPPGEAAPGRGEDVKKIH
ncbi:LacI family DNA-binding transcriptional regulator [Nitratireductor sp. CAU 1489]|uniref:LacI family DNA-binding transcriptional regulator n=1 Tax=Nitratireductor arenosus TaxID=2682096 RepID=A0A844Q9Y7_9HYPH|nr:LacI family DNA-binding transcriptional regulator [Nitratireductor arenosus]MVA96045.1 LacI family DNA-binding transcriptional regulator [Nitratireductor arenosus]